MKLTLKCNFTYNAVNKRKSNKPHLEGLDVRKKSNIEILVLENQ